MDKFFIRFYLQRMFGALGEEFPYETIINADKEEISEFIEECEKSQQDMADKLSAVIDLRRISGKRIMFIGDSLTADRLGYRGIVTKAAKLNSYNAAVSGATSTDMLRYAKDHIVSFNPEIISIMIGTNDSLIIADEKNLVSLDEYRKNISKIIKISKESGAKVIISTIPPTDEDRFSSVNKSNNNINIEKYCDSIREEARINKVILNDFYETIRKHPITDVIENDGIHLTKLGQFYLAENWLKSIKENL